MDVIEKKSVILLFIRYGARYSFVPKMSAGSFSICLRRKRAI